MSTKTTKYAGVSGFDTQATGEKIGKLTKRLPTIFLIGGLLFRIGFLVVIIPELQAAFDRELMAALPFFVVTIGLTLLAELIFSVSGLAFPSLYSYKKTRFWALVIMGFSVVGLLYNGFEMYWFVEDYLILQAYPENTAMKPHLFLQMCNILAWFSTETAGYMLIYEGRKFAEEEEIKEKAVADVAKSEESEIIEAAFFSKTDEENFMFAWEHGDDIIEYDLKRARNSLKSARKRYEEAPTPEKARTVSKWESLIARQKYTPTPQGAPSADIVTGADMKFQ